MALNVTFDGICSLDTLSPSGATIKYQALFFPDGTGSSSTTWNNVRLVESSSYYNINLGDADWLSQTGTALVGSKVLIVFWKSPPPITDNRNALCNILEQWSAFEITLDGSDIYTNAIQVKLNIDPDLFWTLPLTGFVNTNYSTTNSSEDEHSWLFGSVSMEHIRIRYGENIQLINTVKETDYDWDDSNQDLDLPGAAIGTHQWVLPGIYTVEIKVRDECDAEVVDTKNIKIYWHSPTCGIKCNGDLNTPDSIVTFEFDGTDVDGTISSIDWYIHDSGVYGNTDTISSGVASAIISHTNGVGSGWCGHTAISGAFTNPGSHLVEADVHWNDGFDDYILNCSETFTQQKFAGPVINFDQIPPQATVSSGVKFVNTSTNISRVGLGLPDCTEYEWIWNDDGNIEYESDKPYAFELEKTPTTVNCKVKLCADWSDGWDTLTTCEERDVVFETKVTVTPEECFYNLNIVGTSSDGSVSGYSWDIYRYTTYSGVGPPTGPTELMWESPEGLDQQDKKICFTVTGWYKIIGFVHGTGATTSDYEDKEIAVVCVASDWAHIWNGTGVLDFGSDWVHSGFGFEADYAKHAGTYGLDALNMVDGTLIKFSTADTVDVTNYDLLSLWVNIGAWEENKHINIEFYNNGVLQGNSVRLDYYLDKGSTGVWQKVFVSLSACGLASTSVDELRFVSEGAIGVYLDDIIFGIGSVVYTYVPGHEPEMSADEFGELCVTGKEAKLKLKAILGDDLPMMRGKDVEFKPKMLGKYEE